jgi:2-polyprenyl-6-methoxyphenol hydroxylase-like FAD-dependent oxidoreductase
MHNQRILISGASIAGPSLAYWLNRHGFRTTVVERAPALRGGGFGVDFRGPVHLGLLERMGILDDVRRQQTHMGDSIFVEADGHLSARLPSFVISGDVEIERGELSRILFERTQSTTEYIFGDSIAALTDEANGVRVSFEHAEPRMFDLVIARTDFIPTCGAWSGAPSVSSCAWLAGTSPATSRCRTSLGSTIRR